MQSNPIGSHPDWKWEGYAEYLARQDKDQRDLSNDIMTLLNADNEKWEVVLKDETIVSRTYYEYWIMIKYCMDIKKMSYVQILNDMATEKEIKDQMMNWYHGIKR